MITDSDIKKLKAVFATKDDLKGMASKDDLKGMASKDDLKGMATKEYIGQLKTRIEILEDNLVGEIAKLHDENLVTSTYRGRIEDHEVRIAKIEHKIAVAN